VNLTILDYRAWLQGAAPGTQYAYHYGFLARDRVADDDAHDLGKMVFDDAEMGYVHLTTKRVGTNCWEYRATRTSEALPTEEEVS